MTRRFWSCARLLITSSVMPSARYSLSLPISLANGSTATEDMVDFPALNQSATAAAATSTLRIAADIHSFRDDRDTAAEAGIGTAAILEELFRLLPDSSSRFSRLRSARISDAP